MPVHLPILSISSLTAFRRCPREFYFSSMLRRRSLASAQALRFGKLFDEGLGVFWGSKESGLLRASDAIDKIYERSIGFDAFDVVKAECLMTGYYARWQDDGLRTVDVQHRFHLELPGMFTSVLMTGAIDALASKDDALHVIEHKTTSRDIGLGADYWRSVVKLDAQVSMYLMAARKLSEKAIDVIYDVIRKPTIEPYKATPEEKRKYTKPSKTEPVPRLYAGQREEDETREEYRERLSEDISANLEKYFQRMTVVRLAHEDEAHIQDTLQTAEMIRFSIAYDAWPRNTNACERYGSLCSYFEVCAGALAIDNDLHFFTAERTV